MPQPRVKETKREKNTEYKSPKIPGKFQLSFGLNDH